MTLPDRSLGDTGHVADHDALHVRYNNSSELRSGLLAARPAASAVDAGTLWWATDTLRLSRSDGAAWADLTAGVSDHGALTGLADDDHPQYATDVALAATDATAASHDHVGGDGAQIDHGGLAGLADDDHTQYLTSTRHAAVDAADHGSGAAASATVLTADGSGGASWASAAGGPQGKMLWSPGPHAYRAGAWYPAWDPGAKSVQAPAASVVHFIGPFYVSQSFNIDRIGFNASTVSGNARVALYVAASDGRPGSLVVESADTAVVSSINSVTVASTALTANTFYYLAAQLSTGGATVDCYDGSTVLALPHTGSNNPIAAAGNYQTFLHSQSYGAFPATPTLTTGSFTTYRPILFVRSV